MKVRETYQCTVVFHSRISFSRMTSRTLRSKLSFRRSCITSCFDTDAVEIYVFCISARDERAGHVSAWEADLFPDF